VIEHVIKAIMSLSDRIYVLDQGKLIAEGLPDEVINNEDVIKSYLGAKKHA
jgi:branched-chain amino acid transport system ATP-binding protein